MTTRRTQLILTNEIISKLETDTIRLLNWFEINRNIIDASKSVKLLGIKIDKNLNYNVCKKVNLKLHALGRISQFMDKDKLRVLMEAFIGSRFGYCPLIWMHHSRTLNVAVVQWLRASNLFYNCVRQHLSGAGSSPAGSVGGI